MILTLRHNCRLRFFAAATIMTAPVAAAAQVSPPITPLRDNSFLIEEAYNQERGVVQHISVLAFDGSASRWNYGFTQEWPLGGERHQLSYTIPLHAADEAGSAAPRLGDIGVNYRLQLGSAAGSVAAAPRASLILPTSRKVAGAASPRGGFEVALPLSLTVGDQLVTHGNASAAFFRQKPSTGSERTTRSHSLGMSVVWLVAPRFNLLVESVARMEQTLEAGGAKGIERSWVISPGARMGFDFASGLQIVPGIAFPIGLAHNAGENDVLLYLSFEHPFGRPAADRDS